LKRSRPSGWLPSTPAGRTNIGNTPKSWRKKKLDPEARQMAVRLFQIAAWLDPAKTGRGALLGLVSVAHSGEEEARFRAAAYLFDPRHDKACWANIGDHRQG